MPEREKRGQRRAGTALKERGEERVKRPRMWRVIIHNDDFTPVEFVVSLVAKVFRKNIEEASRITMDVHLQGAGTVGVYTHEIAETKIAQAEAIVSQHEHPLQFSKEPVETGDED